MSLINDALKRASQSDRNRARPTEPRVSMQPVAERRGTSLPLVLGGAVVLALGLAGWCFAQWWNASHPPAPAKLEPVAAVAPKPAPAPAPVVHEVIPPPPAPAPTPLVAAPAPAQVATPVPQPAPPPPAKPVVAAWPANLKLMGIFFNEANPRALINGKTLVVGDQIEGIRVSKIERERVTMEWNGQVKELIIE
jgi:hypothetical protein